MVTLSEPFSSLHRLYIFLTFEVVFSFSFLSTVCGERVSVAFGAVVSLFSGRGHCVGSSRVPLAVRVFLSSVQGAVSRGGLSPPHQC